MSRTARRRASRAATLSATLLLSTAFLAACNSEEPPAVTSSEESSESTTPTPSESEEAESPADEPAAGEQIETSELMEVYRGAFDEASTAHMKMEVAQGASAMTMEGDVDYTTTPMTMGMTMSAGAFGDGEVEMRLVDSVMYMKIPGAPGGKFVSMNLDSPTNPLGETFTEQLDPRSQLETFEKGITAASYLGEEELEGDTVKRYRVTVGTEALLESMEPEAREQARESMPEQLTYDLFFGDDNTFRGMEVDLGAEAGGVMRVTFSDWGKDVSIQAPPPGQVTVLPGS